MELTWNEKECFVAQVKRGNLECTPADGPRMSDSEVIQCLMEGNRCKFLGILENVKKRASKVHL